MRNQLQFCVQRRISKMRLCAWDLEERKIMKRSGTKSRRRATSKAAKPGLTLIAPSFPASPRLPISDITFVVFFYIQTTELNLLLVCKLLLLAGSSHESVENTLTPTY